MKADAALKSQDIAMLAERNHKLALQNQRKELYLREEDHKRNNNWIHHLSVEVKDKKKQSSADICVEYKCLLERKRSLFGGSVFK